VKVLVMKKMPSLKENSYLQDKKEFEKKTKNNKSFDFIRLF